MGTAEGGGRDRADPRSASSTGPATSTSSSRSSCRPARTSARGAPTPSRSVFELARDRPFAETAETALPLRRALRGAPSAARPVRRALSKGGPSAARPSAARPLRGRALCGAPLGGEGMSRPLPRAQLKNRCALCCSVHLGSYVPAQLSIT